jgi:hypothetical protein
VEAESKAGQFHGAKSSFRRQFLDWPKKKKKEKAFIKQEGCPKKLLVAHILSDYL